MSVQRRQLLQILSYAFGSSIIPLRNQFALAAQNPAQPASPATPAEAAAQHEVGGTEMETVTGIGGLFFRSHDPKASGRWYLEHLGIALTPSSEGDPVWEQGAGPTAFTPFPETSKYFGDPNKVWMVWSTSGRKTCSGRSASRIPTGEGGGMKSGRKFITMRFLADHKRLTISCISFLDSFRFLQSLYLAAWREEHSTRSVRRASDYVQTRFWSPMSRFLV